jgi:hypothetical protein
VRQEIDRLKALYDGFHYRELARILLVKLGYAVDDKTVKKLWQDSPVPCQGYLRLWDYHVQPDRYQARLQIIKLYYQGWGKVSISRFLKVSRPTVDAWIQRFETEHFAGLGDRTRAPKAPSPQDLASAHGTGLPLAESSSRRRGVPDLEPPGMVGRLHADDWAGHGKGALYGCGPGRSLMPRLGTWGMSA